MKNVSMLFNIILGFIVIILLVLLFSTNYHIIKIDTNSISAFSQEISQIDSVYINLNKRDIQKAISILEKGNITNDDLLNSLESQKETFVLIILFLTLLIAAAGLFSIVQTLTTQSEQEKLKKLSQDIKDEVVDLKYKAIIAELITLARQLRDTDGRIILDSGKTINDINKFKQWLTKNIYDFETDVNEIDMYDKLFNNEELYITIINFIVNSITFALENDFLKSEILDVTDNELFRFWLDLLSSKMNKEHFNSLKDIIKLKFSDVNFGEY